jgi:tetratricopeptide (TPR) repeat protein
MVAVTPAFRAVPERAAVRATFIAEFLAAVFVLGVVSATLLRAYAVYAPGLATQRLPVPGPMLEYSVRRDDRDAVERLQRATELLGEAVTYRASRRPEWAEASLAQALALDPNNTAALAVRDAWAADPAPPLTPTELADLERENHLYNLLGAAISILDAEPAPSPGSLQEARAYVDEALTIAPSHPTVLELSARLSSRS